MGGIMDKLKGAAKKIEGKLTGDRIRTAQGSVEEAKGDVEIKGRRVANKVKAGARRLQSKVAAKVQRGSAKVNRAARRNRGR